jgi:hypothetical protein
MKKIVLVVGAIAALAVPSLALAASAAPKPTKYELMLARIECGKERGVDPVKRAEFRAKYPAKNPLAFCIRFKAHELALERAAAPAEARLSCQQEKAAAPLEFRLEYPGGLRQCISMGIESTKGPKPNRQELMLARIECGKERGADPVKIAEFNAMYAAKRPLLFCIQFKAYGLAMERGTARAEARTTCIQERAANPAEFRLEYPGGLRQCIQLESMP